MADVRTQLLMLQHGDTAFPSSATSFSWGLETLVGDGRVHDGDTLRAFVESQLRYRWAPMDRPMLLRSYRAAGDLDIVAAVDRELEAMSIVAEFGAGSRQMGRALLRVHARLGTAGVAAYQKLAKAQDLPSHAAAVEGLVRHAQGMDQEQVQLLSAWSLAGSLCSAMIRLGKLGPLESQQVMQSLIPVIEELLNDTDERPPAGFVPEVEAAGLRHQYGSARIFGN